MAPARRSAAENGIEGSGTVRNAGTITGADRSVNFTGSGTNTLILQTGSVLIGDAAGSTAVGATNKLILQGAATTSNNNFVGLQLTGIAANSFWVLNGKSSVGTATISGRLEVGDGSSC